MWLVKYWTLHPFMLWLFTEAVPKPFGTNASFHIQPRFFFKKKASRCFNINLKMCVFFLSILWQKQLRLSRPHLKEVRLLMAPRRISRLLRTGGLERREQARRTSVSKKKEEEETETETRTRRFPGWRGARETGGGQSGTHRGRNMFLDSDGSVENRSLQGNEYHWVRSGGPCERGFTFYTLFQEIQTFYLLHLPD